MMTVPESAQTILAVERTFSIIRALKKLRGAGVTELSEYLDMSKGGVHKHLTTLVEEGYVTKANGTYRLSFKFMADGEFVKSHSTFYELSVPEIDKLAARSDNVAYLSVAEREEAYCVYRSDGDNSVATDVDAGTELSMHTSAAGKAILAHLQTDRRERFLNDDLPAETGLTAADVNVLETELERIRDRGIAFEDEESVRGIRGVGAPIQSPDDEVLGAVAISGPMSLLDDERFKETAPDLVQQTRNFIEVKISLDYQESIEDGSHVPHEFY